MKSVKFLRHFSKWNGGETACFNDDYAQFLVEAGQAQYLEVEAKAEVAPAISKVVESPAVAKKKAPRKKKTGIFGALSRFNDGDE